jgi:hypothetical protein
MNSELERGNDASRPRSVAITSRFIGEVLLVGSTIGVAAGLIEAASHVFGLDLPVGMIAPLATTVSVPVEIYRQGSS